MKILKYKLCSKVNHGTEEAPNWVETLHEVTMGWNEANEEIAKREAYNGEYTIEDDGNHEEPEPTQEDRISDLEEAIAMILNGVTE